MGAGAGTGTGTGKVVAQKHESRSGKARDFYKVLY